LVGGFQSCWAEIVSRIGRGAFRRIGQESSGVLYGGRQPYWAETFKYVEQDS
jgi:hypothetical protein